MNDLEGTQIFIIEDNVVNMAVFATTLKHLGANVAQDAWNSQTIELLKSQMPIDLIIMDLMLRNGVSGYDLFEEIQQDEDLKHIPVVAVSSLDPATEIPKAKEIGMAGFISKPIDFTAFPNQLLRVLAGERVWIISR